MIPILNPYDPKNWGSIPFWRNLSIGIKCPDWNYWLRGSIPMPFFGASGLIPQGTKWKLQEYHAGGAVPFYVMEEKPR